jgi:hypothetical protein
VEHIFVFGGSIVFQSEELKRHLTTSTTIETEDVIFAEWNLNDANNVERVGNYRYRPGTTDNQFSVLPTTYDPVDLGNYYTGATSASVVRQTGVNEDDSPTLFTTENEKMKMLYSLDDCVNQHRPRSGINKLLYLGEEASQYVDFGDQIPEEQELLNIARRPRYYMSSRKDFFKYWTSYRTESVNGEEQEFGISKPFQNGISYIDDAAPFVVYKEQTPANKIIIKMQTNVGEVDLGPFRNGESFIPDPLYGFQNQTTPQRWSIEVLKNDTWVPVINFNENSVDSENGPVIKSDGYVEIAYGLVVPDLYRSRFIYAGELADESLLPEQAPLGYAFLVKESDTDIGIIKYYNGDVWVSVVPEYRWFLNKQTPGLENPAIIKPSNPDYFINNAAEVQFREFDFIRGIRIVIETMNKEQCTFDLIEFSPRLFVDVTEKTSSFSVTKMLADLGNGSVPVGNIFASTGTLQLLDEDFSFNPNNSFNFETNTGSILSKYSDMRSKFLFYQVVRNIENFDYFIPIKTLYVDEIPAVSTSTGTIDLTLRDFFFYFESTKAPELLMTNVSLSYAVTLLLDYIGFSNYVFRRINEKSETIIPFFFTGTEQNVAEMLQKLAVASQTAMFFDEYNNFVVMSKEYLLPEENERATDNTLYGQDTIVSLNDVEYRFLGNVYAVGELPNKKELGAYLNLANNSIYVWNDTTTSWQNVGTAKYIANANIISVSSEERRVYNQGSINYTTRYLQRAISKYNQAPFTDKYKTYGYKPSLLWEVPGKEQLRSQNEPVQQSEGFVLSAVPLNTSLSDEVPVAVNNQIQNNIIDLGEGVDNVSSYQGYFYANGEVIKYDAMEYAIVGPLALQEGTTVWITNNQDYQKYFSRVPFNGKMYPTGNIRIFVEPEYEVGDNGLRIKNGPVKKHGRGQFGTPVVAHDAGLNPYWSSNDTVKGCVQKGQDYLFNTSNKINYPALSVGVAGKTSGSFNADLKSRESQRLGIIKNFRANKYYTELENNYFNTDRAGTLQSSALIFNGPELPADVSASDFVSYVHKELTGPYTHFGTRMRIVGKIEAGQEKSQTPSGSFPIYTTLDLNLDTPEKNIEILGGSGGLAFNVNPATNVGYYFEIVALTQDGLDKYKGTNKETITKENILSNPKPSVSNNVVTLSMENQTSFQVGQRIVFSGMSDENATGNTATPINGEYRIQGITDDKKQIRYTIPTPDVTSASIISATGDGNVIKYVRAVGNSRQTQIKAGDKINISGMSNSAFNVSGGFVKSARFNNDEWAFTVEKTGVTGTATGGTVTYVALTTNSRSGGVASFTEGGENNIANIFFYKIMRDASGNAIPFKLWSSLGQIITDDGKFTGQYRFVGEENPTVYDLDAEYVELGSTRRFYLYINGRQVATVDDTDPLPKYNNMALFVRGSSYCMFENIYAIGANISQNSKVSLVRPISEFTSFWGDDEIDATEALRKYALSGVIQKTYLSGIGTEEPPSHVLYFEEFGTIMREAAYLNIKYDRSFPALYARLMKTFNKLKGYAVSGFYAGSYGADFLIFNCQDTSINLDDTTGNFLRIQGITFTQNTTKTLTVDDYYAKLSNFSNPITRFDGTLVSPFIEKEQYDRILNSRSKYGSSDFTLESEYIQSDDAAEDILGWTINKISEPKLLVGINTFGTFNLQLGDILNINYKNNDGIDVISPPGKRYVVYNMEYNKGLEDSSIILYLVEV